MAEDVTLQEALASRRKFKMFLRRGDVLWKGLIPEEQIGRYDNRRWYVVKMNNNLARTSYATLPELYVADILEAMDIRIERRLGSARAVGCSVVRLVTEETYNQLAIDPLVQQFIAQLKNDRFVRRLLIEPVDPVPQILAKPLVPYLLEGPDHDDADFESFEFLL